MNKSQLNSYLSKMNDWKEVMVEALYFYGFDPHSVGIGRTLEYFYLWNQNENFTILFECY